MSRAPLRYLSTLAFSAEWLAELRNRVPGVVVEQVTADAVEQVPDSLWAEVEVLHTSSALPDPDRAPRLRWVQLDTAGVDHVVGTALWASAVPITSLGGVSAGPLAEFVLFQLLGFAHHLPKLLATRDRREWPRAAHRFTEFLPTRLAGATLGVVGYGRIGRQIGRLARGHGMRVLGVTRSGRPPDPACSPPRFPEVPTGPANDPTELFGPDGLYGVLAASDYVVLVVPLTPETAGLIDSAALAAMRPGAVLVNVSRGGVLDEAALLQALRAGHLRGAALDVFATEPLPAEAPWWREPGVFVTPHVSGLAPDYAADVLALVSENLRRLLAGEQLLNCVDRVKGY